MTIKQVIILGIALVLVGAGLIIFSQYSIHEIEESRSFSEKLADFLRDLYVRVFGGEIRKEPKKYHSTVLGSFYAGIFLVIIGAVTAFFGWLRTKRP